MRLKVGRSVSPCAKMRWALLPDPVTLRYPPGEYEHPFLATLV